MRYELYIRMPEFADRLTLERALAALKPVGFGELAGLPAEMDLGGGTLRAEPFRREEAPAAAANQLDGINLGFPMGSSDEQGDRAISACFALAQELGASVFDPQLGQLVVVGDHDRIVRTWKQGYAFQADVAGAVGLGHGSPDTAPESPGMGGRLKYLLGLAGVLIVVILLFRSCLANYVQDELYSQRPPVRGGSDRGAAP